MHAAETPFPRAPFLALASLGVVLAVYGSLVPLDFARLSADEVSARIDGVLSPAASRVSRIDLAVNFALFVPVAFFGLGYLARGRTSLRACLAPAIGLTLLCLLTSCAIEFAQVWVPSRVPSGLDIVAQLVGTATGIALWIWLGAGVAAWVRTGARALRPRRRLEWALQAWAVGLFLYSILPLDLTLSPADLAEKWNSGRIRLVPFSFSYDSTWEAAWHLGLDVALFVPIGLLAGLSRPRGRAFLFGAVYVLALETIQLLVFSRLSTVTDLLTGAAGVGVGVWCERRIDGAPAPERAAPPRHRAAPWVAGGLWSIALVAVFWAPFDFRFDGEFVRPRLEAFFSVPLTAAQGGGEFLAASALLRKVLLFAPLGAFCLWAVAPFARVTKRAALVVLLGLVAGLAIGIELGQVALPDRTGRVGDALLMTLGALAGVWFAGFLMRRHTDS